MLLKNMHTKCISGLYPFSNISRAKIPDDKISWTKKFENYSPTEYESPVLQNKPWADPKINNTNFKPIWNELDGKINRKSYEGFYQIVDDNRPLNPIGRTGITGRGVLGRWGPNHAADPIVTRWKYTDGIKQINNISKLPILQFCAIQRQDCGQWAIPGGMVDPGEQISQTLRREFMEEAFNSIEESDQNKIKEIEKILENFFKNGIEIYRGYVDDPRNTDNAWMETIAVNFHDENNSTVGKFNLQAGDDAKSVKWMDIDRNVNLYASHTQFLEKVANLHRAHW